MNVPKGKLQDLGINILPYPVGHVLLYPLPMPGVLSVNMTNIIDIDGIDIDDLNKAKEYVANR